MASSVTFMTDAQPAPTPPETWQLRLLGGALGALCSGMVAIVTLPTIYLAIVALVGVPAGTVAGLVAAPTVVHTRRRLATMVALAAGATVIGAVGLIIGWTASQAAGAQGEGVGDLVVSAAQAILFIGYLSLILGLPVALVVAFVASYALRRLAPSAGRLWMAAAVVVTIVLALTAYAVVQAVVAASDQAAASADRVPLDFVVDNEGRRDYWVQWASSQDPAATLDPEVPFGGQEAEPGCTSGGDAIQGTNWGIWLWIDPQGLGGSAPGAPLVSSVSYGAHRPVAIRLTISPQDTVTVSDLVTPGAGC
jgi:hypothetical protein